MLLSTCNRVEIYANVEGQRAAALSLKEFLSSYHRVEREVMSHYLYSLSVVAKIKNLVGIPTTNDEIFLTNFLHFPTNL